MLLEALRDFQWYNDPKEFSFGQQGVKIISAPQSDFWQDKVRKYSKDDGHFFYGERSGSFAMSTCWRLGDIKDFAQSGLMGRIDENHWFKISIMSKDGCTQNIGTVVTNSGNSDMALTPLDTTVSKIWFKVRRSSDGLFELSYSLNGATYSAIRRFRLLPDRDRIFVGVYCCSPSEQEQQSLLTSIEFD